MKILFLTSPGAGHVLPVVSSAWALAASGHEIVLGTSGGGLASAEHAGLTVVDIARGVDLEAIRGRHLRGMGALGQHERFQAAMAMFAEIGAAMSDGAVGVARELRPDLVVHTPLQAAGPLAAAAVDARLVEHGFQLTGVLRTMPLMLPHLDGALSRHGLAADKLPEAIGLDVCPPSLRGYEPAGLDVGYRPYNGGAQVVPGVLSAGDRPRICVTMGTSIDSAAARSASELVLDVAADLDLEVVLAEGDAPRPDTDADVVTSGWLPLAAVLPHCDAVVHHGGAGTTLTAAFTGTPQLVVPQMADQHFNAARLAARGVAAVLDPADLRTPRLRDAVGSLVAGQPADSSTGFATACRELAAEMRAMPDLVDVWRTVLADPGAGGR